MPQFRRHVIIFVFVAHRAAIVIVPGISHGDVIDVPGRRDPGSYPSSIRDIISDIIIKVGGGGRGDLALREATEERDQAHAHLVRAWSIPHRVASAKSKFLENSR